ncbi:c-type cytochrome [Ponticoccus sp. (in: a-proteobacteria)]|uniref:cytochrome c oxidase subunit II n=1 Tax=Ponticoccus sp. (in: a-proteobacteria) TaxID=1925025 RepID=UPI003AB53E8A
MIPAVPSRCRACQGGGRIGLLAAVLLLSACEGRQSALSPAGEDAAVLSLLFWVMLTGAVVIFCIMLGLFFYLTRVNVGALPARYTRLILVGGGIVWPTLTIGALLVWGLSILPDQRQPGDGLRIRVTGEQWWWRVEYFREGSDTPVISANEIRFPAGQRTELELTAGKVIHSLWIPALGGKLDMFPGRETRMSLKPLEPGVYRGQCAEFCGMSHAWMAFEAVVLPEAEFEAWLAAEEAEAKAPATPEAQQGAEVFAREGCGACHVIRGTDHVGLVGPDLTHVGSRHTLGAGRLGNTLDDMERWLAHTGELKPGVEMPTYDQLPDADRRALALYLKGLE